MDSKIKMVDMARTPAEIKARNKPMDVVSSGEKYGYGLSICLDSDALKKLGVTDLPEVGDEFHIIAIGKVTSTSKNASESNDSSRVEIQITNMAVMHEDEMEEKTESPAEEKKEQAVFSLGGMSFK